MNKFFRKSKPRLALRTKPRPEKPILLHMGTILAETVFDVYLMENGLVAFDGSDYPVPITLSSALGLLRKHGGNLGLVKVQAPTPKAKLESLGLARSKSRSSKSSLSEIVRRSL